MYRVLDATGLRERSRTTRALFRFAYFRYKRFVEDPFLELTINHPEFFENGHVIDVGANLGYTADVFARAVGDGWKVIAFEPDATNFVSLANGKSNVIPIQAAVGRRSGELRLWHNHSNPADHRIVTERFGGVINAEDTTPVDVVSIDDYLAGNGEIGSDARVSFCKIDVQGFELEVLRGMRRTIEANPGIVLAVEYCPWLMRDLGLSESAFFWELNHHGFNYYLLRRGKPLSNVTPVRIKQIGGPGGYVDIVCTRRIVHKSPQRKRCAGIAGAAANLDGPAGN